MFNAQNGFLYSHSDPVFVSAYMDISSVQSLSRVRLFATPWITAHQATLSITNSQSLLKLMSIESVMPSSHPSHPLIILIISFVATSMLGIGWHISRNWGRMLIHILCYTGSVLFFLHINCGCIVILTFDQGTFWFDRTWHLERFRRACGIENSQSMLAFKPSEPYSSSPFDHFNYRLNIKTRNKKSILF